MSTGRRGPGPSGSARDPTGTTTIRKRFAERLRGRWAAINTEIREAVGERDVFRVGGDRTRMKPGTPRGRTVALGRYDKNPDFEEPAPIREELDQRNQRAKEQFITWLEGQISKGVLEVIHRDENPYIRAAYSKGVQTTLSQFAGRTPPGADTSPGSAFTLRANIAEATTRGDFNLSELGNYGVHRTTLQSLYSRAYENLESVTDDTVEEVREEITKGFAEGLGPDEIARNITDRTDKIGKTGSTRVARTETINAANEAAVTSLESAAGNVQATIVSEWLATDDDRTCPICETIEGETWEPSEVRTATFEYEAGEDEPPSLSGTYPAMPPAHPQCRCTVVASFPDGITGEG